MGFCKMKGCRGIKCDNKRHLFSRRILFIDHPDLTDEHIRKTAIEKGWTKNTKTTQWFCPQCSEAMNRARRNCMSIALTHDHWEAVCDCFRIEVDEHGQRVKKPCGSMFWRYNPPMTEKEFREDILSRGWTINEATGRCFCPRPNSYGHWKLPFEHQENS